MKELNIRTLTEALDTTAEADLASANIGGASLAVIQHGDVVYKNYFGNAKPDSVYRLASMTKPITAVAALILMERGKLKLTDKVSDFLPGYAEMHLEDGTPVKTPITLLHLLTHTSGMETGPLGQRQLAEMPKEANGTLAAAVECYAGMALSFEPFTAASYSGVGAFDVIARMVELASGKSYADFIREEITEPLGMTDTAFVPTDEQWARMIPMHNKVDDKSVFVERPAGCLFQSTPVTHTLGGAGLASTLDDYIRFAMMLKDGGTPILSEASVRAMGTPHVPESMKTGGERWGLGVRVITGENNLPIGAFGWSGAYGTHFFIDPENDIAAVYMKNSLYDGGSGAATSWHFERNIMRSLG